ncbi:hypothetical protein SAMN02910298_00251 [Pseudobutyrivibrio sp. YE44]|uniref:hypothetical protein n=1 Tax=Pseudobutyrivibrio sp. YE44 TaxID=1520802 RepID=UPI00088CEB67|nr:hypothetical protein [Pseudobutyrivibrio sp. YE44]SDB07530.1 hypothetical protein SAMN02910298_00251 [Pseudobutyrivibrio sp. YE44]
MKKIINSFLAYVALILAIFTMGVVMVTTKSMFIKVLFAYMAIALIFTVIAVVTRSKGVEHILRFIVTPLAIIMVFYKFIARKIHADSTSRVDDTINLIAFELITFLAIAGLIHNRIDLFIDFVMPKISWLIEDKDALSIGLLMVLVHSINITVYSVYMFFVRSSLKKQGETEKSKYHYIDVFYSSQSKKIALIELVIFFFVVAFKPSGLGVEMNSDAQSSALNLVTFITLIILIKDSFRKWNDEVKKALEEKINR